ncbi:MAG: AmmeMemoRadiSam system protein B [Desulfobacterales bacterium]|nr:AmmeMemoRadiSam system protein B [Desulfobacterales bacterium]
MGETAPAIRKDLELIPIQHGGKQLILIRDHLGLVREGKAIEVPLYHFMTLLDGTRDLRDLQTVLMREGGGVLVGSDEVRRLLTQLDQSFLLDSDRFKKARDQIVGAFVSRPVRPPSHSGHAYPDNPSALKERLDNILASHPPLPEPEGEIVAFVAPHIDLSVGGKVYSSAYQLLKYVAPSKVVLLGVGHQMMNDLFCLTEKDFETPLGVVKADKTLIRRLCEAGGDVVAADDFAHRSEHSIEFQVLFLQHQLAGLPFTIVPILCGSFQTRLREYSREAYLSMAGPFLRALKEILNEEDHKTLVVAGVDFSHVGPKFGHGMPARHMTGRSEVHDRNLLGHLARLDADQFWGESTKEKDQYNVCGFSALACLMEVLPPCRGQMLEYQTWHEEATRSAVSFAAMVFTT